MEDLERAVPGESSKRILWQDSFKRRGASTCVLSWKNMSCTARNGAKILKNVSGLGRSGEILAILGPSGSGKSTLLNCLAQRNKNGESMGSTFLNRTELTSNLISEVSTYVLQENSFIGALTVRETVNFSAKLTLDMPVEERADVVDDIVKDFGLGDQANQIVGTTLTKGLSGGQLKRLSIASQLVTLPKIVFLDEPTSGLDSMAAYSVVKLLKNVAKEHNLIIILSVHSPSTATYNLFDRVLLLSKGETVYTGPTDCQDYFKRAGDPVPEYCNPADHLLDATNVDFTGDEERLHALLTHWNSSEEAKTVAEFTSNEDMPTAKAYRPNVFAQTAILTHRLWIKSTRDFITYGVRLVITAGLAVLTGVAWLRLGSNQSSIESYTSALFFSSGFMSLMALSYIPAFLEDRANFVKERGNGLYGTVPFLLSNFVIGIPFLLSYAISFSLIAYWLIGLKSTTMAFVNFVAFLFLDLVAAESLVVLASCLVPSMIPALSVAAFFNAVLMTSGGFLVPPAYMNGLFKNVLRPINFLRYSFESLMENEFVGRSFSCITSQGCVCQIVTSLVNKCEISGEGVMMENGYLSVKLGSWAAFIVLITFVIRVLSLVVLHFNSR